MSKTKVLVKVNYKRLKTSLVLKVKKFGLAFLVPKLGKFLFFDGFFLNLANFWDLDNFLVFGFTNFSINLSLLLMSLISLIASTLLASSILLAVNTYDDRLIFSIEINSAAILLNP